jgi:hypothetical protein
MVEEIREREGVTTSRWEKIKKSWWGPHHFVDSVSTLSAHSWACVAGKEPLRI